jgi:hypothetical protein
MGKTRKKTLVASIAVATVTTAVALTACAPDERPLESQETAAQESAADGAVLNTANASWQLWESGYPLEVGSYFAGRDEVDHARSSPGRGGAAGIPRTAEPLARIEPLLGFVRVRSVDRFLDQLVGKLVLVLVVPVERASTDVRLAADVRHANLRERPHGHQP